MTSATFRLGFGSDECFGLGLPHRRVKAPTSPDKTDADATETESRPALDTPPAAVVELREAMRSAASRAELNWYRLEDGGFSVEAEDTETARELTVMLPPGGGRRLFALVDGGGVFMTGAVRLDAALPGMIDWVEGRTSTVSGVGLELSTSAR